MKKKLYLFLITSYFGIFSMNVNGEDYPIPQQGEIWGGYLDSINSKRTQMAQILARVPAGVDGQSSPWFSKLQSIKLQLDHVAASKAQTDLFLIVPNLADVFREEETLPFVAESFGVLANLSVDLISSAGSHVEQQNGIVSSAVLTNFVKMFAVGNGFVSEPNWEERPMPIDAPGVTILDATAVVAQLKAGSWRQAKQFLGGATTANVYFGRYIASGDGLAVLKTKYAANQSTIDAKFIELKTWADQQERNAESGN
jgi:hypothetical protein